MPREKMARKILLMGELRQKRGQGVLPLPKKNTCELENELAHPPSNCLTLEPGSARPNFHLEIKGRHKEDI